MFVVGSLTVNLGVLGFFKYYNFFVQSLGWAGGWSPATLALEIALPVGVSFYTFQSIAYVIDVYRGRHEPVRSLLHYAAFVCYFPQLVAGPINRIGQLMPQMIAPAPMTAERAVHGAFLFCVGFFRKAIADALAMFVDPAFTHIATAAPAEVVMAVFTFGLQIYLDFSGYVDMARGVSHALGIDLVVNFDAPYLSTSPREFWRRWHISLSQWLRDYLYISLGGNRKGLPRHMANLMITMLLGGLWHGAGVNFIIWGGLHGIYLAANTLWDRFVPLANRRRRMAGILRTSLGWAVTYIAVNYAWLYFRAPTFADAMAANRKILEWLLAPQLPPATRGFAMLVLIVAAMEWAIRLGVGPGWRENAQRSLGGALARGALGAVFFTAGLVLLIGRPITQFIYFQF
jgi:D-alanyl-lipoteichoic acid acyltransferase DltB (MBOAT superfamily)